MGVQLINQSLNSTLKLEEEEGRGGEEQRPQNGDLAPPGAASFPLGRTGYHKHCPREIGKWLK